VFKGTPTSFAIIAQYQSTSPISDAMASFFTSKSSLSAPSRKMSLEGFDGARVDLNLEQYSILEGYTGAQFHQYGLELIQTEAYKRAEPPEKKTMIGDIKKAASAYGKAMVLDSHGIELFKKAGLNYFKKRRETPYWEYLPKHLTKTYKNQQELPTKND